MTIKKGELVILNDAECPEPRMIVMVSSIQKGVCFGDYISTFSRFKKPRGAVERVTKVADFGITLQIGSGRLHARETRVNYATYPDGKLRRWQGNGRTSTPIKTKMLGAVTAAVAASQ